MRASARPSCCPGPIIASAITQEEVAADRLDRNHEARKIARLVLDAEEHHLRRGLVADVDDARRWSAAATRPGARCRAPIIRTSGVHSSRLLLRFAARQPTAMPRIDASSTVLVKKVRNRTCDGNQRMQVSSRKSVRKLIRNKSSLILRSGLDTLYSEFNAGQSVSDPVWMVHRYERADDREVVGVHRGGAGVRPRAERAQFDRGHAGGDGAIAGGVRRAISSRRAIAIASSTWCTAGPTAPTSPRWCGSCTR